MRRYPVASKKEEVSNYPQPGSQLLMDPKTTPNLRVAQKLEPHDGRNDLRCSSESLLEKKKKRFIRKRNPKVQTWSLPSPVESLLEKTFFFFPCLH